MSTALKFNDDFEKLFPGGRLSVDFDLAFLNLVDISIQLNNAGVHWGLVFGTLLGAVRESDFIAHDKDVDIFVRYEDIHLIESAIGELSKLHFSQVRFDGHLLTIARHGQYVDIYLFERRWLSHYRHCHSLVVPVHQFASRAFVSLRGRQFPTVSDPESLLDFHYGIDWAVPKVGAHYQGRTSLVSRALSTLVRRLPAMIPLVNIIKSARRQLLRVETRRR